MARKPKEVAAEVIPRGRGAPVKYRPEMCETLVEVAKQGGHVMQMCAAIGIKSKDTFYRWLDEYEDFNEAYQESKIHAQAFYENLLLMGAVGKIPHFNFSALAMLMNSKFGDEYKRVGNNTEINIGSINSIGALSSEALDAKIQQLQEKLGVLTYDEREHDSEADREGET